MMQAPTLHELQRLALHTVGSDEVVFMGSRTREEKDAELRKRAIDLDSPSDEKRIKRDAALVAAKNETVQ